MNECHANCKNCFGKEINYDIWKLIMGYVKYDRAFCLKLFRILEDIKYKNEK